MSLAPRVAAAALLALAAPSLFALSAGGTSDDMQLLASELTAVIGADNVIVERAPRHIRASVPTAPVAVTEEDRALVDGMNRERASRGLPALQLNGVLCAAAEDRVRDMFAKHYFDHVSPDGIDPFSWAIRRGYDYRDLAENLAVGYRSAAAVIDGWMHSTGHRRNLLGADYREVGVAIVHESPTSRFTGPLVVAIYGARMQ